MPRRQFEVIDIVESLQHWHAGRPKSVVASGPGGGPEDGAQACPGPRTPACPRRADACSAIITPPTLTGTRPTLRA